jgi:hypothetical protein
VSDDTKRKPSNFDWIAARGACSIRQMFEELRLGITQDLEAMSKQAVPMGEPRRSFKIAENNKRVKVYEDDPFRDKRPII